MIEGDRENPPCSTPQPQPHALRVQCTGNPLYCHLVASAPAILAGRYHILSTQESTRLHVIPSSLLVSCQFLKLSHKQLPGVFFLTIASIALAHLHKPATHCSLPSPEGCGCHQSSTMRKFLFGSDHPGMSYCPGSCTDPDDVWVGRRQTRALSPPGSSRVTHC